MYNFDIASKTSSQIKIFGMWKTFMAVMVDDVWTHQGLLCFQLTALLTVNSYNAQSPREQVYDIPWESEFALQIVCRGEMDCEESGSHLP